MQCTNVLTTANNSLATLEEPITEKPKLKNGKKVNITVYSTPVQCTLHVIW